MQAYPSPETFRAELAHANALFVRFADDDGYPRYSTIATLRDTMKKRRDAVAHS